MSLQVAQFREQFVKAWRCLSDVMGSESCRGVTTKGSL